MKYFLSIVILIGSFTFSYGQPNTHFLKEKTATIEFEETEYDFGTIESGEVVSHAFKFKNTSNIPLTIRDVEGGCGCTVASFPEEPVMPNEKGEIRIEFDSKNKRGDYSNMVKVKANTHPSRVTLKVKGRITIVGFVPSEETDVVEAKSKNEAFKSGSFSVYPNPTQDYIQIDLKDYFDQSAKIEIFSESGQKVITKRIEKIPVDAMKFDLTNFGPGVYHVSICIDDVKPMAQRFIVLR